jgi:hypothetical protein
MIPWPVLNSIRIGKVLRSSSWDTTPGIIADETRSGKLKVRADHIKIPDGFNVTMFMTLLEYRIFRAWWENVARKGVYTFGYPKIDDNTGDLVEYQFVPGSKLSFGNTTALNLEVTMSWMEAT